ncbi:MAG: peptidylprolyl isomerase [Woeseia sp.]
MNQQSNVFLLSLAAGVLLCAALPAAAQDDTSWRTVDPARTAYMQLPGGEVIIELNPDFAPATVLQFQRLVSEGFYDGLSFYRVVDGFVAQGGDGSDMGGEPNGEPMLPAEFEREWADTLAFVSVQKPDMFAPETGFIDGFAAGRDTQSGKVWLTHCPGVVAMARNNEPDTGSTDFYIVIGQAPRYLDRNLTIFGRVVHGMDVAHRTIRGPAEANGMIAEGAPRTTIEKIVLAGDLPAGERKVVQVSDTMSDEFADVLQTRKKRGPPFFHHEPPEVLDVCQVPVATRLSGS